MSVILCTYNQGRYLREAVESVLSQTYANIELVAIDNGSTDGSRELLQEYADDPRVRLMIHDRNEHLTRRLNEGIDRSSGEFISILYGDDVYLSEKTAKQVAVFRDLGDEVGIVHGPGYRWNMLTDRRWTERCNPVTGMGLESLLAGYHRAWLNPIAPLVRRACFERYRFDERVFGSAEFIFVFMAFRYHFAYLSEPLVVMREHRENRGKAFERNVNDAAILFDALGRSPEFPRRLRPLLNRVQAADCRNLAWKFVRVAGDGAAARRYYARAIRRDPAQLLHPRTLAGLCLSTLPTPMLRSANSLANRIRRHRAVLGFNQA